MAADEEILCKECGKKLQIYELNLTEKIRLCPTDGCLYPLDISDHIEIISNDNGQSCDNFVTPEPCPPLNNKPLPAPVPRPAQENFQPVLNALTHHHSNDKLHDIGPPKTPMVAGKTNMQQDASSCNPSTLLNLPKSMESIIRKVAMQNKTFSALLPTEFLNPETAKLNPPKRKLPNADTSPAAAPLPGHLVQKKTKTKQTKSKSKVVLQWPNADALCWLDVILCLFVHNKILKSRVSQLHEMDTSVLKALFAAYEEACLTLTRCERDLSSHFGSGQAPNIGPKQVMSAKNRIRNDAVKMAVKILEGVRERVWKQIQSRVGCEKNVADSPIFALLALEKQEQVIRDVFTLSYCLDFTCTLCGYRTSSSHNKILPTLEAAPEFSASHMLHIVKCAKCNSQQQRRILQPSKFSDSLLVHFLKGVPFANISHLDFSIEKERYKVTGLVQYTHNPDHFVAWVKYTEKKWVRCDDLQNPVCTFMVEKPPVPPEEVHLVMWEKVSTSRTSCPPPLSTQPKEPPTTIKACLPVSSVTKDTSSANIKPCLPTVSAPRETLPTLNLCPPNVPPMRETPADPMSMQLNPGIPEMMSIQRETPMYSPGIPESAPTPLTFAGRLKRPTPMSIPQTAPPVSPMPPMLPVTHPNCENFPQGTTIPRTGSNPRTKILPVNLQSENRMDRLKANLALIKKFKR